MTERQKRLAWAAVIVAGATGISRIVGVAREILTANAFGVSVQLNTFASVAVIPNLIRQLVADAAISAAFVPVFTGLFAKGERERAYKLASSLLSFMVVVVGSATVVLMVGAPLIVRVFFPQFADQAYVSHLAVDMLRILLPTVLLFSVSGVVIGVLYSYERFTMPAVVSIVWNLVIIAFIVLFSGHGSLGIYALVWGTFFGTVAQLLLLLPPLRRIDLKWSISFAWRDPLLRRVLVLMVPVTITLGILNFNALVDFFFAQFVSDHAAAQINYAFRLYQLPQGMFAITIGTVLFPTLSRYAADLDMARFRETLSLGRAADLLRLAAVRGLVRGRATLDRAAHLPARPLHCRRHRGGGAHPCLLHAGHGLRQRERHVQPRLSEPAASLAAALRRPRQPGP